MAAMLVFPLAIAVPVLAAAPGWDVSGSYGINLNYNSVDYPETLVLTQVGATITGGTLDTVPPGSLFTVTGGSVDGNSLAITATQGSLVVDMNGTIASNGSISGTWADQAPGTRTGTWTTTSGAASALGVLAGEDFGVVNYDVGGGLGIIKGYTAGFGLTDATFAGATSVVVQLFNGNQLLQTNTAILPQFNVDITGTQFSSPFDVSGTFAYATDGYWTNARESEFGQSVPATKVIATVTLANGKIVTASSTNLTGDPTTIYPAPAVTIISVATSSDINVPNGTALGSVGLPANVTVTLSNLATSSLAVSWDGGLPAYNATTTGTYVFTGTLTLPVDVTNPSNLVATVRVIVAALIVVPPVLTTPPSNKDQCKNGGWMTFNNPTYKNQGQCVSSVQANPRAKK